MTLVRIRKTIDSKGVRAVMDAAEEAANSACYRVVMAVVDAGGNLLELRRTEGAQPASAQVAIDKARTAAIFVRPSREIEEQVGAGRLGALALHGARALTGGIPLTTDGEVVGAIGTSGETPDEDESVSKAGAAASFSSANVHALTYAGAKFVAEVAAREAVRRTVSPVVAVVDASGELMYLWRPDGAQVASVGVATDKARTAAIYRRPSKDFEDQASGGRPSALHLAGAVPLQGGMPLLHDGEVVGAVGVSGASSAAEDQELSALGARAIESSCHGTWPAIHLSAADVDIAFANGGLLVDAFRYQVEAAHRTGPGEVERHDTVTDIMRVAAGTATLVTRSCGATLTHELATGDVVVIPEGIAHEFTAVSEPFRYFVVKVQS